MKPSRRIRRWFITATVLLMLFTLVGFFVLPPIIRTQAEKRLSAELGRTVTLGKVRLNPYALSLTLEDFDIREKGVTSSFLGWQRLYLNVDLLSSLTGEWVVSDVELDGFHAAVAIQPDGSFNFSDLLAKFAPPPTKAPAEPSRPVRVVRLAVTQARVNFNDRSLREPFASVVGPLTFALTEFRTAGARGAPYRFEAQTEAGEKLTWRGTLAADPLESKGEFEIANLILKKYTPYFADRVRADLTDGKLTVSGGYEAGLVGGQPVLKLNNGQVHLRDLRVLERDGARPAVELPSLDVTGIQADAVALKGSVARVALAGGHLTVRREKDGGINLLNMLQPATPPGAKPSAPSASASSAPAKLPEVTVGEIALKDFAVDLTDQAAPRPAQLALGGVQFSLKNFSLADGATMPLALALTWAPKGTVQVTGTVALKPDVKAELKTEVTGLEILPLSPYLEQFANARLTGGVVSTANTVKLALAGGAPAVEFDGDLKVEKFGLVDEAHNAELAGFSSLALSGLKAATTPQLAVSLAEINLAGPYARVFLNADQTLNLASLAKTAASATPAAVPPAAATAPPPPKIEIGRIVLADGDFSFTDRSIEPNVRTGVTQFGGTVAGLSSANLARAEVDLKGTVDGTGPVAITGKLDPLGANKFVDLKVDVKNVDLLPLSPYTGKYAGYELARGKLLVDVKVLLEGKKIDASNVVTLNQFTFGTATNSKDATALPVRLGVALLKDTDGKIVIDLPVQGNLDDPNFRIGKVVLRVVVNLLTKAATSPFSLLGSMFGGGGDELAFQEFAPGAAELQPAGIQKLDTMVKALVNRPALSLGLEGSYDAAPDTYEVKRRKLADLVLRRIWEARHAADPNIPPPAQLTVAPEERAAMIKKLFDEKFPPGTQFGTPLPPPPAVTAPPPAPRPGFFKRITNAITFAERRQRRAAEQENAQRATEHEKAVASAVATGLPPEEMSGRLAETMEVTDNDLRALATARAQRVRDYFITTGHIAADRLFLAQSQDAAKQNKGPRVFLSLQ